MNLFVYDKTFDGLLSVIFEAFRLKLFPDALRGPADDLPLLAGRVVRVETEAEKAGRVWRGLQNRLSRPALRSLMNAWLTVADEAADELIVRYARRIFAGGDEADFSDPDVLAIREQSQKVAREKMHLIQFVRFQKTAEGIFFASVAPRYDVLPLVLRHFTGRFGDQQWIIRDLARGYGFYYDLTRAREVRPDGQADLAAGRLEAGLPAEDEILFQEAWKKYFQAVSIESRANPKLQRQYMPRRFWPLLIEKQ
ncbi:MAG: TIGR03915 family putative DNA repair protein [Candidatus Adiutrix sp.]|jgi:probable DNA metabolism protein|nr:TIGR03915 family putative DNA repair protein [Candidatus Adiutrix sp.]